jgi:hypothetical protein
MSTTDSEEPMCEMQEEGVAVPTMDVESDLSPPSMDRGLKILLGMKVMHAMQSTKSTYEISHSEPSSPDGISEAGDSNASSWISEEMASGGLSFFTAVCTITNQIGASLYLPWAFAQGGTLLTTIVLAAVVLQAYITASFLLEASARAQALELLMTDGSLPARYTLKIRERKYELSLLTKIFLGKAGTIFFSLTALVSMYGGKWAFCNIFANAFADKLPSEMRKMAATSSTLPCLWLL